jgi:hypothetical protein
MADRRRAALEAALIAALLPPTVPELRLVRAWMDTWTAIGAIARGMARCGYRLHLTNIEAGGAWRATFSGQGKAWLASDGFGAHATPWKAVQLAAWNALKTSDVSR